MHVSYYGQPNRVKQVAERLCRATGRQALTVAFGK
jgi:hypothetical protein